MKTISETRMECLRMATSLATAKAIPAGDVEQTAARFYAWVREEGPKAVDQKELERLRDRFRPGASQ